MWQQELAWQQGECEHSKGGDTLELRHSAGKSTQQSPANDSDRADEKYLEYIRHCPIDLTKEIPSLKQITAQLIKDHSNIAELAQKKDMFNLLLTICKVTDETDIQIVENSSAIANFKGMCTNKQELTHEDGINTCFDTLKSLIQELPTNEDLRDELALDTKPTQEVVDKSITYLTSKQADVQKLWKDHLNALNNTSNGEQNLEDSKGHTPLGDKMNFILGRIKKDIEPETRNSRTLLNRACSLTSTEYSKARMLTPGTFSDATDHVLFHLNLSEQLLKSSEDIKKHQNPSEYSKLIVQYINNNLYYLDKIAVNFNQFPKCKNYVSILENSCNALANLKSEGFSTETEQKQEKNLTNVYFIKTLLQRAKTAHLLDVMNENFVTQCQADLQSEYPNREENEKEKSQKEISESFQPLKEKLENAYDAYEYLTTDEKEYEDEHRIQNSLGILRAQKEFAEKNKDFVPEELERDKEGKLVEYYTNDNGEEVRAADHLKEIKSKDKQLQEERNDALMEIAKEARNAVDIATDPEKGSEDANAAIIASAAFMTDHGAVPTSTPKGDSSTQLEIPEETMQKAQTFYEKMVNWWDGFTGNLKATLTQISEKRTSYQKRFRFKGEKIQGQETNEAYRKNLSGEQEKAREKMLKNLKA